MTLDAGPIGALAMALMEILERDYEGQDVRIRAAMVLVDVQAPDPEDPSETWTHVRWQFGEAAEAWDTKRSSSAYAAGLVGQAYVGLTEGSPDPPP